MPLRIVWSEQADTLLLELRRARTTWDGIAGILGVSRNAAIDRGKRLLLQQGSPEAAAARLPSRQPGPPRPPPAPDRRALPAGHPLTWNLLTAGTCLDGAAYPYPVFLDE